MKNKILIVATVVVVIIAICVIAFIPKNNGEETKKEISSDVKTNNTSRKIEAKLNDNGDVEVLLDDLDTDNATFITYMSENGKEMELVAVKDSSGNIDIAFNTCQVCNGSPKAYFVQENKKLICENCGNVFSLKTIGQSSGGCNPMTISKENVTKTENGIQISKEFLNGNEMLFANVEEH